ncbi:MAG: proline--tRNA ligase [Candidatus Aminicenantes bacterium]|nr:proline--tRNA ligase [Candidatus Aminicenantes bacterium]NIM85082.1 proline--tRNA ligase [Candidatus Aminicenantes bacterium]NIN24589.1 proline--tRNA ligase [Candidatus Aminicenantes bacterium]NIN48353.1 proline--tRNA ligase [Candidatus Aminicenantes bacterium]NIN91256.1 proline--tRNA ligase [Candidatus Aminicenantes bacterium]
MSKMFSQTLREAPSDAQIISHQLLERAGFIRQLAAGIFSYMPLAKRSLTKIENIMREEINAIGGQEMTMPVTNPASIWQETRRWYQIGGEMARFKDRNDRDMLLAMTHEEVVSDLTRKEIRSYRQLPQLIYHIQTKFRDDPRPRAGLIRVREFTMKDSYTLDADEQGLDKQYRAHYQAYFNIFHRCGLPVIAIGSDVGMMGGSMAHEFMYLTPIGEDSLLLCDKCGYKANRQVARFKKPVPPKEELKPMEKVATPDASTIDELCQFLNIPPEKTAKALFMMATVSENDQDVEKFVLAIVRGDMELNETKLTNAVKAKNLVPALDEEIRARGIEPGYGSPVGVKDILVVVDDIIPQSPNLVGGANEEGYHLLNVNVDRDFKPSIVCDIAAAEDGSHCPQCGAAMRMSRGIELGNIFKLGTRYSETMGCMFLDKDGKKKPIVMGSYGIGSGRLLASVAEEYNDENGLIWPITAAPYHVHIVLIGKEEEPTKNAEKLYNELQAQGVEVLYDDRYEQPGVKFTDADLIGLPLRLTVSSRALKKGGVELKRRSAKEITIVPLDKIVETVKSEITALKKEITDKVIEIPFEN